MNRLKLWVYVALLLGAGAGNLYFLSGWLTARSIAHVDRELRSSAAVADARVRWLGASTSSIADSAARSPALVAAFADPAASPLAPAEDAITAAAGALKSDAVSTGLVAVAGPQGAAARAGGASGKSVEPPQALLQEAQAGRRSQGWVRIDGALWLVAAAPAGRGGAIAFGVPLDAAHVQALRAMTGVDFTGVVDGKVSATTLPADDAGAVSTAQGGRKPVDIGRLGRVNTTLGWGPPVPILFAHPPATRALAVPLEGAGDAVLVLSHPAAPFFAGLATYQVIALVAMALFLLVGLLLGLFMSEEARSVIPRELVSAADRIARGDFSARAPSLPGSAGHIASALNRAAEAAQHGRAPSAAASTDARSHAAPETAAPVAPGAEAAPNDDESPAASGSPAGAVSASEAPASFAAAATTEVFPVTPSARAAESEPEHVGDAPVAGAAIAEPEAASAGIAAAATEFSSPEHDVGPGALIPPSEREPAPGEFEAEPAFARADDFETALPAQPAAEPARSPWDEPAGSEPTLTQPLFAAAEPKPFAPSLGGDALGDAPPAEAQPFVRDEDESHWRSVFDDFVRLRGITGEARDVPYEQFRARLERNRAQLVDKHAARTVRFQPYVKDGKVALRATPVR